MKAFQRENRINNKIKIYKTEINKTRYKPIMSTITLNVMKETNEKQ